MMQRRDDSLMATGVLDFPLRKDGLLEGHRCILFFWIGTGFWESMNMTAEVRLMINGNGVLLAW
jgi:hypothetical protein